MSAETIPTDVIELVAKTIHDHWQGAPGLSARPWDGEKGTCTKLPAQAEDFRRKARAVMEALATRPAEPAAPAVEAVDREVVAWLDEGWAQGFKVDGTALVYDRNVTGVNAPLVRLSALEAERTRADAAEQRAAVALARAEKAEDWQPIETAPVGKNGIAFMMLAFGPPGDQTVSEGMHFNGCFYAASVFHQVNPSDGRHFVFREHEVRPTHWRPTLAPPRASREAQPATDGGDNG